MCLIFNWSVPITFALNMNTYEYMKQIVICIRWLPHAKWPHQQRGNTLQHWEAATAPSSSVLSLVTNGFTQVTMTPSTYAYVRVREIRKLLQAFTQVGRMCCQFMISSRQICHCENCYKPSRKSIACVVNSWSPSYQLSSRRICHCDKLHVWAMDTRRHQLAGRQPTVRAGAKTGSFAKKREKGCYWSVGDIQHIVTLTYTIAYIHALQ